MAVRNGHARYESPVVYVEVDGKKYAIYSASWEVDRAKRHYVASKLKAGKVSIPENASFTVYGTTIVYATKDNKLTASEVK